MLKRVPPWMQTIFSNGTTVGGVTNDLVSLWQSPDGTGWAVGWNGSLLARRDNSWSAAPSGTKHDLTAIWGSAPLDIWIVGKGGFVSHYDGRSWTPAPSVTSSGNSGAGMCPV